MSEAAPKRAKAKSWMKACFDNFEADIKDVNDQSESCAAKLYFLDADDDEDFIVGATGHGGHAEMHALTQFIRNECGSDENNFAEFQLRGIWIECPAKSCCQRCSIILGALNIGPVGGDYEKTLFEITKKTVRSGGKTKTKTVKKKVGTQLCHGDTYKVEKSMGSTEWGLAPDIRTFLAGYLEVTEQQILSISSLSGY